MTIDAIIGNPPYQAPNEGDGQGSDPLYHLFFDIAMRSAERGALIHPARFLFHAGKTPKEWNRKMLANPHYQVARYVSNSAEIFPSVEIKGGIAISIWDRERTVGPVAFFTPHERLRSIAKKVACDEPPSLSTIVAPRELYRLTVCLYSDHPELSERQSARHQYSLGANAFDILPELFLEDPPAMGSEKMVRVYGRQGKQRCYKWINARYINCPASMSTYRVLLPKSNGSGKLGEPLSHPIVGEPYLAHTDSFLSIGSFGSRHEAEACLKYIKTKLVRALLGILKVTQDNPKETWRLVPLQDFGENADIDWTGSVEGIGQALYAKYDLTKSEISFVESMVTPMR